MAFLDETGVTTLTSDIKTLTDTTYPANAAIINAYSSSSSYVIGDYCIYNGLFYKCNTAISSGESWTPSHWTQTNVATELASLKVEITDRYGVVISDTEPTDPEVNGWLNTGETSTESIPQINDSQTSSVDTYSSSKIDSTYLSYDSVQNLTSAQQEQVTSNMGFIRDVENTNKYCKFPDGTMIQWGYYEQKSGTTSSYSPIYIQGITITFPTSFIDTSYAMFGSARWGTGAELPIGVIENNYVNQTTIRVWDIVSRTSTTSNFWKIRWMAIGRWK